MRDVLAAASPSGRAEAAIITGLDGFVSLQSMKESRPSAGQRLAAGPIEVRIDGGPWAPAEIAYKQPFDDVPPFVRALRP